MGTLLCQTVQVKMGLGGFLLTRSMSKAIISSLLQILSSKKCLPLVLLLLYREAQSILYYLYCSPAIYYQAF